MHTWSSDAFNRALELQASPVPSGILQPAWAICFQYNLTGVAGVKVTVAAIALLAALVVFPRLALLSVVGVERVIVSILLTFEQAVVQAGWTLARWVGSPRQPAAFLVLASVIFCVFLHCMRAAVRIDCQCKLDWHHHLGQQQKQHGSIAATIDKVIRHISKNLSAAINLTAMYLLSCL